MEKLKVLGLPYGGEFGTSHLVRVLAVCEGLRDAGNYDVVVSGENCCRELVGDKGFEFVATPGISPEKISKFMGSCPPKLYTKKMVEYFSGVEKKL